MIIIAKDTSSGFFLVQWKNPNLPFWREKDWKEKEFNNFADAEGFLRQREKQGMICNFINFS